MRLSRLFCRFVRNFAHSDYFIHLETRAFHFFFGSFITGATDLTSPDSSVSRLVIFAVNLFAFAPALRKLLSHTIAIKGRFKRVHFDYLDNSLNRGAAEGGRLYLFEVLIFFVSYVCHINAVCLGYPGPHSKLFPGEL